MAKTTSFQLSDEHEAKLANAVESGGFNSASEVMRRALDQFFENNERERELHAALDRALRGPRAKPGVFARLRAKHGIKE
jgi:putative addiction module CopG family antidote